MGRASGRLARHNPFGHLYLHTIMMVFASVATTSFVIILLFSLPSCLHLSATPFLAEGVGACASSPYSPDTIPNTDSRSGYCTSTRTFHIMRAPSFSPSLDAPFVFPAIALFFLPNLLPHPRSQSRADGRSSTRVRDESVMLLAFLRVCRRGGHGGACHTLVILATRSPGLRYWTTKARSVAAVGICYRVGGGVVSHRRV
jgi:hypothetical protein